jgi:ATP-dependent helicase Lhr and Lhr-like helicase
MGAPFPIAACTEYFLRERQKGRASVSWTRKWFSRAGGGDTIILGASTWRVEEISHNQVIVSPAPGEPGKMPFWRGDSVGRPAEFGKRIGEMIRELSRLPRSVAFSKLVHEHSLDANAAENLLNYLGEQMAATTRIPSDEDIIVEVCRDEMGDRRVCVLTPFGRPVHIPWCMAVTAKLRAERGLEVESMWSDDGFVLRLPDSDESIASDVLFPTPGEFKDLVLRQLGSTSLFAAKFREAAGRALLLPKRRPGLRAPLWQQRKRAADLLAVASQFSSFPILLETYRECIRDVFDLPAAANILSSIQRGAIKITNIESTRPSPFAASLLFSYVANYIYEGDAPLAERRAQALSIDQSQLEELLGDSDLRELLDANALDEVEARLQSLEPEYRAHHGDGVNDLLLKLGDLSATEIAARCETQEIAASVTELVNSRRAIGVRIAGELRYIPVEYASRYRDALGTPLPPGLPEVVLAKPEEPLREILRRYARTHGPFTSADVALRYGLSDETVQTTLRALHGSGKLLEGEFRPSGRNREWCDPDVLQRIRRKSLARLRREVEPVDQRTFARLAARWQGVTVRRRGLDALLDTIENLQGAVLLASELESEILPARLADYRQSDLDAVIAAGQVVWTGVERVGERDGRVALYLTESLPLLIPPLELAPEISAPSEKAVRIMDFLARNGASFFTGIHAAAGGGFSGDTRDALWELAWSGKITNDTFFPVREFLRARESRHDRRQAFAGAPGSQDFLRRLRSRTVDGSVQGRWSLLRHSDAAAINVTEWSANIAQQLLVRHGIVLRETAIAENIPRGYPTVYPALKTMEESGVIRRGMFVAGLGAAQFAMPGAIDMLRSLRVEPQTPEVVFLAATDPANPYGTLLPWPRNSSAESDEAQLVPGKANSASDAQGVSVASAPANATDQSPLPTLSRTRGAAVILINGELCAFLRRQNPALRVFLPESEPEQSIVARALSKKLGEIAIHRQGRKTGLLIGSINGVPAREHFLARFLEDTGFVNTSLGFQMRRVTAIAMLASETKETSAQDDPDDIDTDITESA